MKRIVLLFVLSVLFGVTLSGSTASAGTRIVELVALTDRFLETIKATTPWEDCGSYFAVASTPFEKILRLSYFEETGNGVGLISYTTAPIAKVTIATDVDVLIPIVTVNDENKPITLTMNIVDHLVVKSCLGGDG